MKLKKSLPDLFVTMPLQYDLLDFRPSRIATQKMLSLASS
jgi:hypothetical protein